MTPDENTRENIPDEANIEQPPKWFAMENESAAEKAPEPSEEKTPETSAPEEKKTSLELGRELERSVLTEAQKNEAGVDARSIDGYKTADQVDVLLKKAQEKGLPYANEMAKSSSPLLLDAFHDRLAQDQLYKKFLPK